MFRDKTMQTLAAVCVLFLLLILAAVWSAAKTERLCDTLLASADACLTAVHAGDLSDAGTALAKLEADWNEHRLFFAATQFHEDLDAVNAALRAASLQLSDNCTDEFYAEIAEIRNSIEKIRDVQLLSAENIL